MFRSLIHYRHLNIAVLIGVAVAASVLTGAFLVGDSVRGSLKAMTLDRLGNITHALVLDRMISADLSESFTELEGTKAAAGIVLRGSVQAGDNRASKVSITGIEGSFAGLFSEGLETSVGQTLSTRQGAFPSAVINQALAGELNAEAGTDLVLSFLNPGDIHRDSVYGNKNTDDLISKVRVTVALILPDENMGNFSLVPSQGVAYNVFLPLERLQRSLDRRGQVNALFLAGGDRDDQELQAALNKHIGLEDLNLEVRTGDNHLAVETPGFFFDEKLETAVRDVAKTLNAELLPISTYLAKTIATDEAMVPYSLVTALDLESPLVTDEAGEGKTMPGPGEVVLTRWTTDDMGVELGETIRLTYLAVGPGDALVEDEIELTLVGIKPMSGLAVDRTLTPDFPGVQDADSMSDWEPPFHMEMELIRDVDEDFWDTYRTAPKAFIHPDTARKMWESRFGYQTGFRLGFGDGAALEDEAKKLEAALISSVEPDSVGLGLMPIRQMGLDASSGSTDFTGLFVGLSFFIIFSAALLVSLFFKLTIEQRRSESGILMTMGYSVKKVRIRYLKEGLLLALAGGLLGIFGGYLYAEAMMYGLRNWWYLGTSNLYLHVTPFSLILGFVIAVVVGLLAIIWAMRGLGKVPLTTLVAGVRPVKKTSTSPKARITMIVSLLLTLALSAGTFFMPYATGLVFGVGACLFVFGLSFLATRLSDRRVENGLVGVWSLASRNTGREAGRSLVSVAMVAGACYVIVAVGLYRNTGVVEMDDPKSATGGFFLEAEADVPLHGSLSDGDDLAEMGVSEETADILSRTQTVGMRLRGGDDASCLNLFAPRQPRFLGLPNPADLAGRFSFKGYEGDERENPWTILEEATEDGAIPVIADENSAMWILKVGLGGDLMVDDGYGGEVKLRVVGMIKKGSIFQSELIMSEKNFRELFPAESGFGYFLLSVEGDDRNQLATALEGDLADFGFDAMSTSEKVKAFHSVENTYISIFQMLGGLGLLLGTLGLGAIIYRNAMERKSEFAAMRAFGYRQKMIRRLLILENAVLILSGIGIGAIGAVVSMLPNILAGNAGSSYPVLGITLLAVFLVGMTASVWAVRAVNRFPLLESLRAR